MIVQLINVHKEKAHSALETIVEKVVKKSVRGGWVVLNTLD